RGKEIPRRSSNAGGRGGLGGCEKTGTWTASDRVPNMSRRGSTYVGNENMMLFILPCNHPVRTPLLKDIERSTFRPTPLPFANVHLQARDFCTLVHFRTLSDGTLAQVSKPVEHPAAPRTSRYVRSEILLAGNFMRPVPGDPSRTEFLMVTHVNPGGAAETRAGAMLVNSLCTSSPVTFIRRLEVAAKKLMLELQQQQKRAPHEAVGGDTGTGGVDKDW
ncbi:unnamed protein product, partial [Ectocarpus sp. 8 AP-2014]